MCAVKDKKLKRLERLNANAADRRRMITRSRSTRSVLKNIPEVDLILHFMSRCLQAVQFPVVGKTEKKK